MAVTDTATSGRVYALSSEHHVRHEVKLRAVSNWEIYALQTEEESGESPHALPLQIDGCTNITVGNFFIYRVNMDAPSATGIKVSNSQNIHFRGLHAYSPGKLTFDNTVIDQTHGVQLRSREIAWLKISGAAPVPGPPAPPPVLETGARIEKLVGGFNNIDGVVTDQAGNVYFVDCQWNTIYRWSAAERRLDTISDAALQPSALAMDQAGNLLVFSRHGNVYAFKPDVHESPMAVIAPVSTADRTNATAWLPVNRWRDSHDWLAANTRHEALHYVSPDGSIFVPAHESYPLAAQPGRNRGLGTIDLVRAYALAPAILGKPFYVSDEFAQKTWRFTVQADGSLTEPTLFAEEGEAGNAVDAEGNVYVCAGQIFVYDRMGKQIDVIEVPERPGALAFGGTDRRTLFIAARTSLYSVRLKIPGR
jgi:sugar lactone lactonase YvrE